MTLNLIKTLKQNYFLVFILTYTVIRLVLLNINGSEWGDSYRILRAAEFLSNGLWPWDEKRWPLYPLYLSLGFIFNKFLHFDVLTVVRFLGLMVSITTLWFVYKLAELFFDDTTNKKKKVLLTLLLSAFTPTFAYWSLRIMADPFFTMLVLAAFYFFIKNFYKPNVSTNSNIHLIALLTLGCTMTRLEGLFVAIAFGSALLPLKKFKELTVLILYQLLVYIPFTLYAKFIYQGDVNNDYFKEVDTFNFSLDRLESSFAYTLFLWAAPFITLVFLNYLLSIKFNFRDFKANLKQNFLDLTQRSIFPIAIFIAQIVLLGFIWLPSVPRIYLPIIPFVNLFLVYLVFNYKANFSWRNRIVLILVLGLYIYFQYKHKLYFLGVSKSMFIFSVGLSLIYILGLVKKHLVYYVLGVNVLFSFMIVYNQKNIFESIKKVSDFAGQMENVTAKSIFYADETSHNDWFLKGKGVYYTSSKNFKNIDEQYKTLKEKKAKYLIFTNEFNRYNDFIDPKNDIRFVLLKSQELPLLDFPDSLGILSETEKSRKYITKLYRIN